MGRAERLGTGDEPRQTLPLQSHQGDRAIRYIPRFQPDHAEPIDGAGRRDLEGGGRSRDHSPGKHGTRATSPRGRGDPGDGVPSYPARRLWVPSVPGSVRGKAPSFPWRGWGRPPGCGSRSRTAKQTLQWQASTASLEWDTVGDLTPKSLRLIVFAQGGTRLPNGFPARQNRSREGLISSQVRRLFARGLQSDLFSPQWGSVPGGGLSPIPPFPTPPCSSRFNSRFSSRARSSSSLTRCPFSTVSRILLKVSAVVRKEI